MSLNFDPMVTRGNEQLAKFLGMVDDVLFGGALSLTSVFTTQTPRRVGERTTTRATNATLAEADFGVIQRVTVDGVVLTLPSTVVGMMVVVENGGADGAVGVSISPAAADKIMGNGFTSADNKDAINTKATAKKGDRMVLVADGVNGWYVQEVVGIWARE